MTRISLFLLVLGVATMAPLSLSQVLYGPTPYVQRADSPFDTYGGAADFWLEDFEDGALNTPGLSAAGSGWYVVVPGFITDSVDEDDGAIDGSGLGGHSVWNAGVPGFTFMFDDNVLGGFPTRVGLVWTDGDGDATFRAYDANGLLIGTIGPTPVGAQSVWTGETDEDRFFGVYHAGGISAVEITNTQGGIEVDHVQYGIPTGLSVAVDQPAGPGSVTIENAGMTPGFEHFNLFSLELCPGAVGSGPYLGLCASSPTTLLAQVTTPVGTVPYHFVPAQAASTFGPYPVPAGITLDVVSFSISAGSLHDVSPVFRMTTQ